MRLAIKILLIKLFDTMALAKLIENERITTFFTVPTMLVGLLEGPEKTTREVPSIESDHLEYFTGISGTDTQGY